MKRLYLLIATLCSVTFLAQAQSPANPDFAKAEKIYKRSCATCHGKQGEKAAIGESKIINQLKPTEISTALLARKKGEIIGAGNPAKQRLSEEDIQSLAEFIATLK
ncbi:c-type cytochrome [Rodentibacter myodis]|uniref:Cytochrome C biogenesis protein CcsB n=1 Tax=Rodentibacter myodis TaxID=1907939 RepID=A0A1V3JQ35_9PAST|nr:c-type cytochrome [Rodentibacter myodis]OOF58781.1 cytochrome C biogenesis protein CcsB [Rodentibacter myodis]